MSFRNKVKYSLVKTLQISNKAVDELIQNGKIKVNNLTIYENVPIGIFDEVYFENKLIFPNTRPLFYKFFKPVGVECTMSQLVANNLSKYLPHDEALFHLGRLDKASEGLLILTNTGQLHDPILRSHSTPVWKKYYVELDQCIHDDAVAEMRMGVSILGQMTLPCQIEKINDSAIQICLQQGLNRQIRRMCHVFGLKVTKLIRIEIGEIKLGHLKPGELVPFENQEINYLKSLVK